MQMRAWIEIEISKAQRQLKGTQAMPKDPNTRHIIHTSVSTTPTALPQERPGSRDLHVQVVRRIPG